MRIGFVAEPYEESHASGMGYAVVQTMRHLLAEGSAHEFVFYSSRPISKDLVPGDFETVLIPRRFFGKLWYFFAHPPAVDVLLHVVPMMPLITRATTILLCKELASQKVRPETVKETLFVFLRDGILMPWAFRRAAHIMVPSHATEIDLHRYYRIPREKVTVIFEGYQDLSEYAHGSVAEEVRMRTPFFLFAGRMKRRKNVHGIVRAFIDFKERVPSDCQLILAGDGSGEYYESIRKEIAAHGLAEAVSFPGYVSNERMWEYYTQALAFVFPSLNEGFGMPILEAMSLGVPVITSSISSMSEVAGDAALLVDPYDVSAIAAAMERMYADENVRRACIEKGKRRAAEFSWTRAARGYLALIERR